MGGTMRKSISRGNSAPRPACCWPSQDAARQKTRRRRPSSTDLLTSATSRSRNGRTRSSRSSTSRFYDAAVADGRSPTTAGYAHQTGGKWRRAMYLRSHPRPGTAGCAEKIGDQIDAKNKKLETSSARSAIHTTITSGAAWPAMSGTMRAAEPPSPLTIVCDVSREEQADAIVTQVFAPAYDKYWSLTAS